MADIVSKSKRSEMMSGIRNKGTLLERRIQEGLRIAEIDFELEMLIKKRKPDILIPSFNTVLLIHGCFWHVHRCYRFKWPEDNSEYWKEHLLKNEHRDQENLEIYQNEGWRVCTIWECAIVGKKKIPIDDVIREIRAWVKTDSKLSFIEGC